MAVTPSRLEKSRTQRILFGVTGGIAEYLGVDVVLVRVVFVVLAFGSGVGLIAYIALAIFMPEGEGTAQASDTTKTTLAAGASPPAPASTFPPDQSSQSARARYIAGAVLIALGVIFLLQELHIFWWWRWEVVWPVALILIGVALLMGRLRR
ncbi:MAG: PspC domain-containing protein [Chloroflexi bacterium]|nr:PspC domain-containing protein [Chloroflexota bacterium]